jgi:hypothetical protein
MQPGPAYGAKANQQEYRAKGKTEPVVEFHGGILCLAGIAIAFGMTMGAAERYQF